MGASEDEAIGVTLMQYDWGPYQRKRDTLERWPSEKGSRDWHDEAAN